MTSWLPAERPAVEIWAWPPDSETGAPESEPSILNWTVPPGTPVPGATGATVAVNVTDWPNVEGFVSELTDVVVSEGFTLNEFEVAPVSGWGAPPPLVSVASRV